MIIPDFDAVTFGVYPAPCEAFASLPRTSACPHSLGATSALTLIHARSHLRNSAREAPKCERRHTRRLAGSGKATCLLDRQCKVHWRIETNVCPKIASFH